MLFVKRLWWLHGNFLRQQLHLMDLAIIRKIIQDLRAMFRYDPSIWDDLDPEGLPTSNAEPSPEPSPSTSCSSSTVTNFWVSCAPTKSDSSSSTTTSSSLVAGCAARATTTRPGSCSTQEESVDQGEHVMYGGTRTLIPRAPRPRTDALYRSKVTSSRDAVLPSSPPQAYIGQGSKLRCWMSTIVQS